MARFLPILFFSLTVCSEATMIVKPPFPQPSFDLAYYTMNPAKTIADQAVVVLKGLRKPEELRQIDCGYPIGKFHNSKGKCFKLGMPDCKFTETMFFMRTSGHPPSTTPMVLADADNIKKHQFNNTCYTVFLIHGYSESANVSWMLTMEEAFMWKFRNSCVNVIRVSYDDNPQFDFLYLAKNGPLIGRRIAIFIQRMMQSKSKADPNKIHLIGFSFGGAIVAYVGEYLVSKGIHLARITGLDPAGPAACYWAEMSGCLKLKPSHAKYVDVIHTNAGYLLGLAGWQLGCIDPLGHVDYYPNGGQVQPTCNNLQEDGLFCSHLSAPTFFISSLLLSNKCSFKSFSAPNYTDYGAFQNGKFFSCKGNTCGKMGFHSPETNASGTQFLITQAQPTYCEAHYLIKVSSKTPLVPFEIELKQNGHSTGVMKFPLGAGMYAQRLLSGKHSSLVFTKGANMYATLSVGSPQIKTLEVTNCEGESKYYCSTDAIHTTPKTIMLTDSKCEAKQIGIKMKKFGKIKPKTFFKKG